MFSASRAVTLAKAAGLTTEILLILDDSDEATRAAALDFPTISHIRNVEFRDLSKARNFAVSISVGDYIAFLDGDDLISENWLTGAMSFYLNGATGCVLHPEFNYYFGANFTPGNRLVFKHLSTDDPEFSVWTIADKNPWTALCFGPREIFLKYPYRPIDLGKRIGFEDWNFNLETLAGGVPHLAVPDTVHFIRQKRTGSLKASSARKSAMIEGMHNYAKLAMRYV